MSATRNDEGGDAVDVDRTVRETADGRVAVTVRAVCGDDPAVVEFSDDLPSAGLLADAGVTGGRIEGAFGLDSHETASVSYVLDGVSVPETERAGEVTATVVERATGPTPAGAVLFWTDEESGERTALEVGTTADAARVVGTATGDSSGARDGPGVAVVATRADAEAAYATVLRATDRGFDVFVAVAQDADDEVARFAHRLGATVVETPTPWTRVRAERALSAAVRNAGLSGVVFVPPGCPPLDYDRSLAALEVEGFETTGVPATWPTGGAKPHVLVAVPAYDAAETVGDVVEMARAVADVVLVVDDGSSDDTAAVARAAGAVVVSHDRNRGYGAALKTAFREAADRGAEHLVTLDADGQHDPADVPKLVERQRTTGAGVVVGSRYAVGSETALPLVRSVGLAVVNVLTNLSMGRVRPRSWVRDTQSGYRAYSRAAVTSLTTALDVGDGMWASTDILYHVDREGFGVEEVGTTIRYDVPRSSSEGALGHGVGLIRNIVGALQHAHPLVSLGAPGLVFATLAAVLATSSVRAALSSQPTLVLAFASVLFGVVSVGLVVLAVVIHAVNTHPALRPRH
ncbi:MAG: glycosyltransferase family 2 protein [Halobacteriaceae archaeon]